MKRSNRKFGWFTGLGCGLVLIASIALADRGGHKAADNHVIHGIFDRDGNVLTGAGYTVTVLTPNPAPPDNVVFQINFLSRFHETPTVTATLYTPDDLQTGVTVIAADSGSVTLRTFINWEESTDYGVNFQAIGR